MFSYLIVDVNKNSLSTFQIRPISVPLHSGAGGFSAHFSASVGKTGSFLPGPCLPCIPALQIFYSISAHVFSFAFLMYPCSLFLFFIYRQRFRRFSAPSAKLHKYSHFFVIRFDSSFFRCYNPPCAEESGRTGSQGQGEALRRQRGIPFAGKTLFAQIQERIERKTLWLLLH